MVFTSLEFLFLFFPIVFIGYLFINPKNGCENLWLLLSSLMFYYIGAKDQFWLLIFIIAIAYISGLLEAVATSLKMKRIILILSVCSMLLTMGYFKYFNFLIFNINVIFNKSIEAKNIALPIGISFFTFQAISYVVDVYRGEKALKNPIDMGLYISFFPQLIAGPIVRFHDISEYLEKKYRNIDVNKISDGLWRFSIGFCKKVLLANNLGGLVNLVYGVNDISQFSVLYTWLGAIAYTLQIYYDFSGYSDMAIGLGKVFGFEFQENFNYPYFAGTIKEFWRRWHISLSQFFRDYVYIPLGGNRCTVRRWILNIFIVWFLTGMWHGASWNYIIWGLAYGVILLIERFIIDKFPQNMVVRVVRRILTVLSVIVLWVVFKCEHISVLIKYLKNMFGIGSASFVDNAFVFQVKNFGILILISIILALPVKGLFNERFINKVPYRIVVTILLFVGMVASISYIYMGSYNPFLYFMF